MLLRIFPHGKILQKCEKEMFEQPMSTKYILSYRNILKLLKAFVLEL